MVDFVIGQLVSLKAKTTNDKPVPSVTTIASKQVIYPEIKAFLKWNILKDLWK